MLCLNVISFFIMRLPTGWMFIVLSDQCILVRIRIIYRVRGF